MTPATVLGVFLAGLALSGVSVLIRAALGLRER